ncbi:MAG: hypothetical protein P8M73_02285 [Luminiphilus sp.]|jgi:hypothetical protein|nr:hypothetical protein [Luminiphilus sp.]
MKERLLDVVAWLAWLWAVGYTLFGMALFFSGVYSEYARIEGSVVHPALYAFFMGVLALGPLIVQWGLFYILTGSPRILPWHRPEQAEEEWWNQ